jgi:hypothetical protein
MILLKTLQYQERILFTLKKETRKVLDKELKNVLNEGDQVIGFYPDNVLSETGSILPIFSQQQICGCSLRILTDQEPGC